MRKRTPRTHWSPTPFNPSRIRRTACGRDRVGQFGGPCYAEYWPEYVSCLVCLYHMGRYMPLVKLREHQDWNKLHHRFQQEFFKPQPLAGL